MSHTVPVFLIADQEIEILGNKVNIHMIKSIKLNSKGRIVEITCTTEKFKEEE